MATVPSGGLHRSPHAATELTLGPKRRWLALDACAALSMVLLTIAGGGSSGAWIFSLGFLAHLVWLLSGTVAVRDDTLFVRSLRTWAEPVLLDQLASIEIRWTPFSWHRVPFIRQVVTLTDRGGNATRVSPVRWTGSKQLMRLLYDRTGKGRPGQRIWSVEIDHISQVRFIRLVRGWWANHLPWDD